MLKKHKQADKEAKVSLSYVRRLTFDEFEETGLFPSTWLKNEASNNHSKKGTELDFPNMVVSSRYLMSSKLHETL